MEANIVVFEGLLQCLGMYSVTKKLQRNTKYLKIKKKKHKNLLSGNDFYHVSFGFVFGLTS